MILIEGMMFCLLPLNAAYTVDWSLASPVAVNVNKFVAEVGSTFKSVPITMLFPAASHMF